MIAPMYASISLIVSVVKRYVISLGGRMIFFREDNNQSFSCDYQLCALCSRLWKIKSDLLRSGMSLKALNKISRSERHVRCLCLMYNGLHAVLPNELIAGYVWGHIHVGPTNIPVLIFEMRNYFRGSALEFINVRGKGYALVINGGNQ